jgi:hypothetical protein
MSAASTEVGFQAARLRDWPRKLALAARDFVPARLLEAVRPPRNLALLQNTVLTTPMFGASSKVSRLETVSVSKQSAPKC